MTNEHTLNELISNLEECFISSSKDLWRALEEDIYNTIPRCCVVENGATIEKILRSKKITLENISDLREKLKIPRKIEKQLRKLMALCSPDLKDFKQSVLVLKNKFDDRVETTETTICYITEPIVLEGAELGRFKIEFSLDLLRKTIYGRLGGIKAWALEPNEKRGYFHPHVDSGRLCSGDAQNALALAITSLDIQAFFEIVEAVLNTYNPESPYIKIEEWTGYTCSDCGAPGLSEYYTCEGGDCWVTLCSDCALFCSECEQYYCTSCYTQSEDLVKLYCLKCERNQCLPCWENTGACCDSCGHWVCPDCLAFICEECDDVFCDSCDNSTECEDCKITFCAECVTNHTCEKEEG